MLFIVGYKYVDRFGFSSGSICSKRYKRASKFSPKREHISDKKTSKAANGLVWHFLVIDVTVINVPSSLQVVNSLLDNPLEEQLKDQDIHKSIQMYSDLVEQTSAIKTTDFDRIRNSVVSLDIQTPGSQQLPTSLFNSALINFPSEGANEQESSLLTTLSFLIFLTIQKGQQMTTLPHRKMSEPSTKPPQTVTFKMDVAEGKEEAVGNEAEPTKQREAMARSPSGVLTRSKSFISNKPDSSGRPYRDYPKEQQTYARHQRPERLPSNEQVATKWKTSVPSQETFQVPAPVAIPPLMSLPNKKAFLTLAVNGQPYGNIVIELQPKYSIYFVLLQFIYNFF